MIWVDGDACPVRAEAERVALRQKVPMRIVCNGGIRPSEAELVEVIYVDSGLDAADDLIAERAGPGDVVVTGDLPLADRALSAGAKVLKPDGEELTERNISVRLAARNAADIARGGGLATIEHRAGKAFSKADRARFSEALDRVLKEVGRA
ncbi:MAG: YaiI/YqxD family protein [Pseudomonadota bacterium]